MLTSSLADALPQLRTSVAALRIRIPRRTSCLHFQMAPSAAQIHKFSSFSNPTRHVAITPDGKLAVASSAMEAKVWDLRRGTEICSLRHELLVTSVALTRNGAHAATTCMDGALRVWSVRDEKKLFKVQLGREPNKFTQVNACTFTKDSRYVFCAFSRFRADLGDSNEYRIVSRDMKTKEVVTNRGSGLGNVRAMTVTSNGVPLIARERFHTLDDRDDRWLEVCIADSGARLHGRVFTDSENMGVAFNSAGDAVVFQGQSDLQVYPIQAKPADRQVLEMTGYELVPPRSSRDNALPDVSHPGMSKNGAVIVAPEGGNKRLGIWSGRSGARVAALRGHSAPTNHCAVSDDGRVVVTTSNDKTVRVWKIAGVS